jgi:hypothetical protein
MAHQDPEPPSALQVLRQAQQIQDMAQPRSADIRWNAR